jgi:mRNA interferase MazF
MGHPSRGEVWYADLDPIRGHEQAGRRPVLVVSVDGLNHGLADLVIVVPITSKQKGIPSHISIDPPDGGLRQRSYALSEAVRSVARERLTKRLGAVSEAVMRRVETALRLLLGL